MAKRDGLSDQHAGQSRKGLDVDDIAEPEDSLVDCEGPLPEPDFLLWARLSQWSIEDARFLAAGLDPMAKKVLPSSRDWPEDIKAKMNEVQFFIQRGLDAGEIRGRVAPTEFLDWCQRRHIEVPNGLKAAVENRSSREQTSCAAMQAAEMADLRATNARLREELAAALADIDTNSRESLIRLVAGMAISKYGYDLSKGKNKAVAMIESDLSKLGIGLHPDTIRKWIKMGAEVVPGNALKRVTGRVSKP